MRRRLKSRRTYARKFDVPYAGVVETKVLAYLYVSRRSDNFYTAKQIVHLTKSKYSDIFGALNRLWKRGYIRKEKRGRRSIWCLRRDRVHLVEKDLADAGLPEAITRVRERMKEKTERITRRRELHISNAKGMDPAEEVLISLHGTEDICILVKTYKWSYDGPFEKQDYEPIIFFYEKDEELPKHAISFSHYGHAFHKNLVPWNDEDYSPRFPNSFHTPVLSAEKTEIRDGILSRGAYAIAKALSSRVQANVEYTSTNKSVGLPPESIKVSARILEIIRDETRYWDEFERI